jgi:hypothetical protein
MQIKYLRFFFSFCLIVTDLITWIWVIVKETFSICNDSADISSELSVRLLHFLTKCLNTLTKTPEVIWFKLFHFRSLISTNDEIRNI